jgi:hypothetical protein
METSYAHKQMTKLTKNLILWAALLCAPVAFAGTSSFSTASGSTAGGQPVDASASFTTGAGTLDITIFNNQVNPTSVIQNVSDLFFSLSGVTSGTLASSSGNEIFVATNGTTSTGGSGVSTGWVLSISGGVFHLDGLNTAADVPAHTIIGAPDGSGVYSNANPSIAKDTGPHNPFLESGATFTIADAAITADTTVSGVIFSFGTESGTNVPGGGGNAPDSGSTVMFLGIALAGCEFGRRALSNRLAVAKVAGRS